MFDEAFPGHETVFLDTNFRSTRRILRVADVLIAKNDRYEAKPQAPDEPGRGCAGLLAAIPGLPERSGVDCG